MDEGTCSRLVTVWRATEICIGIACARRSIGWRGLTAHQSRHHDETDRQERETILGSILRELGAGQGSALPARWMIDPMARCG
jgi:hypothetical protein